MGFLMSDKCSYINSIDDLSVFGCVFHEVVSDCDVSDVSICHVKVSDLGLMADNLAKIIMDDSWILALDKGARRSYELTVKETSNILVDIFKIASESTSIAADFGELMVSMGASRGLKMVFNHAEIPIAELWKPQVKQNEGFDFHTVCPQDKIHFGEAKFSSSINPHGKAIDQVKGFLEHDKHYRDRVHLHSLCTKEAIGNLDDGRFGVVLAFSINTEDPLVILKNALQSIAGHGLTGMVDSICLVGVSHEG